MAAPRVLEESSEVDCLTADMVLTVDMVLIADMVSESELERKTIGPTISSRGHLESSR